MSGNCYVWDEEGLAAHYVLLERIERDIANCRTLLSQALTGGGENPRNACQLSVDILDGCAEKLRQAQHPF